MTVPVCEATNYPLGPKIATSGFSLSEWIDKAITFRTRNYPVSFTRGFLLVFGGLPIISYFVGGPNLLFITSFMVISLITHEYAHVRECLKLHIPINELKFTWFGGLVDADFKYAHEEIQVMMAGVIDTGYYLVLAVELLTLFWMLWRYYIPLNFVGNPYSQLVNVMLITMACVIFPASYQHKKYGLITTDGWGAWLKRELRDELWNDGKVFAAMAGG